VAEDFNSSCSFLWVWSLILKEEHAEGVWEQFDEENIWTQNGWSRTWVETCA
jgi:hypothetical protein